MFTVSNEKFMKDFGETIDSLTLNKTFSNLIFLCIGTDRVIGDSLGPIVGYKLKKYFGDIKNVQIIGDLENNICSTNIEKTVEKICKDNSNPFIISIDSALSRDDTNIGKILVGKGGITIGNGMGKNKYIVGDMFIKGVIAVDLR